MRTRAWKTTLSLAALALAALPGGVAAQGLTGRVADIQEGRVRVTFPTRDGVEICHQGIRMDGHRMLWQSRRGGDAATGCRPGPARVELRIRGGRVRDVEVLTRRDSGSPGGQDLGEVGAREAVEFFLQLARTASTGGAGDEAVFPVILARVDEVWRDLLELARDQTAPEDARESALFWVGQEAAEAVSSELADVAVEEEGQEVRDAAVFALSRRPDDESLPYLMDLAQTAPHPETRRSALFWLAQSRDERVPAFFEEILLGGGGGGS